MYVPNYIPEPLEVPGNIALSQYREKLKFIKQVIWIFIACLSITAAIACFFPSKGSMQSDLITWVAMVLVLDLSRIFLRGKPLEAQICTAVLPLLTVTTGWLARDLTDRGWPMWSVLVGGATMLIYTWVCGRDYSFVGCFFLSLIVSSIVIGAIAGRLHLSSDFALKALSINCLALGYVTYDLASLLTRRKRGEKLAAVADLYRDGFNFFGYFYRCMQHWHRHKIWVTPKK